MTGEYVAMNGAPVDPRAVRRYLKVADGEPGEGDGPPPQVPDLLPQHQALLDGSAILPLVAATRTYRSVTDARELEALGFAPAQRRVPGLLIPIWGVDGKIATHQLRPDHPRPHPTKLGAVLKYETPAGSRLVLDVPPLVRRRRWLGDPGRSLWITEGARKADAAVSAGLACIALMGVWAWRGRNPLGGKTALPDWEDVHLEGRRVDLAFDSDVVRKVEVRRALERLVAFLERRGARVYVVLLPEGPDGEKVGLDDFLARHSVADLR